MWQPIETAPKDGSKIEVWHKVHKCLITVKYIVDKRYRPVNKHTKEEFPWLAICGSNTWPEAAFTHWKELSEPPQPKEQE